MQQVQNHPTEREPIRGINNLTSFSFPTPSSCWCLPLAEPCCIQRRKHPLMQSMCASSQGTGWDREKIIVDLEGQTEGAFLYTGMYLYSNGNRIFQPQNALPLSHYGSHANTHFSSSQALDCDGWCLQPVPTTCQLYDHEQVI